MSTNRPLYHFLVLVVLTLSVLSCGERPQLSVAELKTYTTDPDNGLIKSSNGGSITFDVIYRPKDLIIEQRAGIQNVALWDSIADELAPYDYFILRISRNGKEAEAALAGDPTAYTKAVNYLNETIADDVAMIVGDETIKVVNSVFVPSYGMSNASSVLLVFDSHLQKKRSDFTIVLEDTEFRTGRQEFKFDFDAIAAIPKLRMEDIRQ